MHSHRTKLNQGKSNQIKVIKAKKLGLTSFSLFKRFNLFDSAHAIRVIRAIRGPCPPSLAPESDAAASVRTYPQRDEAIRSYPRNAFFPLTVTPRANASCRAGVSHARGPNCCSL